MMRHLLLAVVFAIGVPAAAQEAAPSPRTTAAPESSVGRAPAKHAGKGTVRRPPRGYGFLPGYEPPPEGNRADVRRSGHAREGRYRSWAGTYYGWGAPGFVRGRWNGGSIGPCWTQTPIGFVWTCGR